MGALDLYRDAPGPVDQNTMTAAQTLADVAATYVLNAQARAALVASSGRATEMSLHDALTGLPNRTLLLERIDHALRRRRRSSGVVAILFADLDQFKLINDMYGHRIGDELLVAVASRVAGHLRPGDTLARFSGDEFVILCEDVASESEVRGIAARIGGAIAHPFILVLTELKRQGLRIALDDFGSGDSSLAILKRFRDDILKVDSWFVADRGGVHARDAVVSAVVHLAHALGLTVTTEGVETVRQFEMVAALGCDACQGHYVGPPMPAAAVAILISQNLHGRAACFPGLDPHR